MSSHRPSSYPIDSNIQLSNPNSPSSSFVGNLCICQNPNPDPNPNPNHELARGIGDIIENKYIVELVKLHQGDGDDEAVVKLDNSRYFLIDGDKWVLSKVDEVFEGFRNDTVEETVVDEVETEGMERNCGAKLMTLAPDAKEYSTTTAKLIASGSGKLIQGILWCGDVTVDQLKRGKKVLRKRFDTVENKEIDQNTLKRIERAKSVTKMSKAMARGVLSGVVSVSGFFMSSVANSKAGKKLFSMLPGEMILASLDGFDKICDALEVAGKEVMSTTSSITIELIAHKYGEEAGKATHEGLDAAGHAFGTVWTVFKIRKALNPKHALQPTRLAKSVVKAAALEYKAEKSKH